MRIGVLALQGDFKEHLAVFDDLGVVAVPIIRASELAEIDGLVIPGGESTTIAKLAKNFGLMDPIRDAIREGLPVLGTCAGLILLANTVVDGIPGQETFGGLDVSVRRNAFGGQQESFETKLQYRGIDGLVDAAFIRAPLIERVGDQISVDAELPNGDIVAVSQGSLMGIAFHPEIVGESRIHEKFVDLVDSRLTATGSAV